jgi:hypothetical protein
MGCESGGESVDSLDGILLLFSRSVAQFKVLEGRLSLSACSGVFCTSDIYSDIPQAWGILIAFSSECWRDNQRLLTTRLKRIL